MLEAGFPEGVLQNLILKTEDIVNVINDARVQGASVTGSVRAGSAVASEAGQVIKKTVLELGGSDAFIVLEDADIPKAVAAGITGRLQTPVRFTSRQNASSSSTRSPTSLKNSSSRQRKPSGWAIPWIVQTRWGRWHAPTFAILCTSRWKAALPRALECSVAANPWRARAPSTYLRF